MFNSHSIVVFANKQKENEKIEEISSCSQFSNFVLSSYIVKTKVHDMDERKIAKL